MMDPQIGRIIRLAQFTYLNEQQNEMLTVQRLHNWWMEITFDVAFNVTLFGSIGRAGSASVSAAEYHDEDHSQ